MAESIHEEEVLGKAYDSRLMRRLLTYLRPYWRVVVVALIAIFFYGLLQAVPPYLMKVEIDRYLDPTKQQHTPHILAQFLSADPRMGILQIALLFFLPSVLLTFFLEFGQSFAMQLVGQKVMYDLRRQIFAHLQRLQLSYYDRNPVGRMVTRLTTDVDVLNDLFASGVVAIFGDIFTLLSIIVVMLKMDWKLALLTFSVLPLIVAVTMAFRKAVRDSYRRIRTAIARINAYLQEHITGMAVLQLFNREERSYAEFEQINRTHMDAYKDSILAYGLFYPTVELLGVVAVGIIIWLGGGMSLRGAVTVGTAIAFIQYSQRFFRPIQDLSDKYNILQAAMAASERIFKLLDTPVTITDPPEPAEEPGFGVRDSGFAEEPGLAEVRFPTRDSRLPSSSRIPSPESRTPEFQGRVEFRNVGFAYRDGHRVVENVSFTIEPGETVAVVGHTGAGKTTLTSLLLRFYDIQEGSITLDGIDIRRLRLCDLRRNFGIVLQDPFLFSGTIASNIRMGTEWITDSDIREAAREVNILDFIESLPGGFNEPVKERGSTLSTGQKQLLSFARAIAHSPRILILDEATSSVDPETEYMIREGLRSLLRGRTSLVIAHRLSTIQNASKIIVMHHGHVREMGTHQELIEKRGIYYKLYQLQYKDQEAVTARAPVNES
ncbi:MAG TPA: ABC transporter ATP-binding protein [Terriglobia bacterium]|nr:ABC transporter ATP-binding protein [Terriglobia bacterium]